MDLIENEKKKQKFVDSVNKLVDIRLKKYNLLTGSYHLGVVDEIISSNQLKVFVDGGTTSQLIPCNPDVTFGVGENVYVVYVNNSSIDKYVLSRRGTETTPSTITLKVAQFIHTIASSITSVGVTLPFHSEVRKDDIYTHSANNSRIYVSQTGWYKVTYNVGWYGPQSYNNSVASQIRKNGIDLIVGTERKQYIDYYQSREYHNTNCSHLIQLSAGDYIEVFCKVIGSSSTITTIANNTTLLIEYGIY